MKHSSSKNPLFKSGNEVIEEREEEDKESIDGRNEILQYPRSNQRTFDNRVELNDTNNLSHQIQLFKQQLTEGQYDKNLEINLDNNQMEDSDKIINEYEEEFKKGFDKNSYLRPQASDRNNPNQLTVTANMFPQNPFLKNRESVDIPAEDFFVSSLHNEEFFGHSKFNLGKFFFFVKQGLESDGNENKNEFSQSFLRKSEDYGYLNSLQKEIRQKESNASLIRNSEEDQRYY